VNVTRQLTPVQAAYDDLLIRTLSKISCDLARLIYLASTRDYNTGNYHHDGLAARFSAVEASKALEMAHRKLFYDLAALSLEELVTELEKYLQASRVDSKEVLRMWQKLEPYRVAIPIEANPTVVRLFLSNVRLALAVWRLRQDPYRELPSSASLPR
jgi:hypothetical protein